MIPARDVPKYHTWNNVSGKFKLHTPDVCAVYADGGLLSGNPSPDGGTWAWRILGAEGVVIAEASGVFTPKDVGLTHVQNNLSEFVAILLALEWVADRPDGAEWSGSVYSDSLNAIKCFRDPKPRAWVPEPLWYRREIVLAETGRLSWHLLDGHPTAKHLAAGKGKRGKPVSEHNAACDRLARQAGDEFMEKLRAARTDREKGDTDDRPRTQARRRRRVARAARQSGEG